MLSAAALIVLGLLPYAASQTNTTAATCQPGFEWAFSSTGESPCDVAAELGGVCVGGQFTLQSLDPGFVYLGPSMTNANSCRCSSVYYSLLSACALCQNRNFIRWSAYNGNCSTVYLQVFQQNIPVGVKVPNYAYLDVSPGDIFNVTAAQADNGPESTRLPSATGTSPAASASTNGAATSGRSKSNTGAIAGGVVGGVVGLAIIAGIVFWFLRRSQKNKNLLPSAPPSTFDPGMSQVQTAYTGTTFPSTYPTEPAPTGSPGRIYDPNDPTTFPTADYPASYNPYTTPSPELNQQHQVPYGANIQPNMQPNYTGNSSQTGLAMPTARPHYTGAPEL